MSQINLYHGDSLAAMREMPDKKYDLAIVDPNYGLGERLTKGGGNHLKFKNDKKINDWDAGVPDPEYFTHLFRISKNQIIWGGNYFALPPTRGYCIWDKQQPCDNFSATEFAWTSFDCPSKKYTQRQAGFMGEKKIHPTQKPVGLYKFLLSEYATSGDSIIDTHGGSGSILIACYEMGFDIDWFENDDKYFGDAQKRFNAHKSQSTMFTPQEMYSK